MTEKTKRLPAKKKRPTKGGVIALGIEIKRATNGLTCAWIPWVERYDRARTASVLLKKYAFDIRAAYSK